MLYATCVKAQTFTQTLITKENDVIIDPEFDPYHKIVAWQSKEGYVCVSNIDTIDWSIDFSSTVVVDSNATPMTMSPNGPEIIRLPQENAAFVYNLLQDSIGYVKLAMYKNTNWNTTIQCKAQMKFATKALIPCFTQDVLMPGTVYYDSNSREFCYGCLKGTKFSENCIDNKISSLRVSPNDDKFSGKISGGDSIVFVDVQTNKMKTIKLLPKFSQIGRTKQGLTTWRAPEYSYKQMLLFFDGEKIDVFEELNTNGDDFIEFKSFKTPSVIFGNIISVEIAFLDGKSYVLFMATNANREVSAEPAEIWLMNMDTTNIQVSKLAGGINDTITDPEILPTDSTLWVYYTKVIDKDGKGFYSMYESDFRLPVYRSSTNIYPTNVFSLETVNKQTPVKWLKIKSEKIKIKEPGIVEVFDKWGSKMAQQKINNCHRRLNTKHLKTGVYDVVLTNKHERKVYKVYVTSKK